MRNSSSLAGSADPNAVVHQATRLTKGNRSVHLSRLEEAGHIAIGKTFRGKYPLTICRPTERGREVLDNPGRS
jgi:hypothetical protein